MTTLINWLNNRFFLTILLCVGVLINLVIFGWITELSKSDWSGWVQAIGSIIGIAVAIYVSRAQHQSSVQLLRTADVLAQRRRLSSVLAVLDQGISELKFVCDRVLGRGFFAGSRTIAAEKGIDVDLFLLTAACDAFAGKPQFSQILEVINRVAMHELGSSELVRSLFQARDVLAHFDDHLRLAHRNLDDPHATARIWNGAHTAQSMLSAARSSFQEESERICNQPF